LVGFAPILEILVKERLTGAIILVVLIVLLVPELLSGPKGRSAPAPAAAAAGNSSAAGTSSEEPPLRSYTINLGDDSRSRAGAANSSGPAMPQPSGPEQPAAVSGTPSQPNIAAPQAGAHEANATAQTGGSPSTSPSNGSSRSTASSAGPQPSAAAQPTPSRPAAPPPAARSTPALAHTVASPSVPSHAKAANAAAKTANAPASTASSQTSKSEQTPKSESGWAVQLGVFASHENAERLAIEVRTKGFKVTVAPVTSGSRKLYRVRVGPAADRAAAQELQSRLKAAGRPAGTVVPGGF
jgi:cell division septation protein DedD